MSACLLALRIARDKLGSILLIDRSAHDPRTFVFWTDQPAEMEGLIAHRWHTLRVIGDGQQLTLDLGRWQYAMIRGEAVRAHAHEEIARAGGRVLRATVERVESSSDGAVIVADGVSYGARWVYDSRADRASPVLRQAFCGWWIETDEDAFDPDVATLMDFRTAQDADSIRFVHVLPTGERRALVTGVSIGPTEVSVALEPYLRRVLGLHSWRIVAQERGVTALDPRRAPRQLDKRVIAIGLTGGLLKPSTGYAWTRMQEDADQIAASLRTGGPPRGLAASTRPWRLLDALFLELLARQGPDTEQIFVAMFARNPVERVLRFLDERASLLEVAALVWTLPKWRWFLGALLSLLFGRARCA